MSERMYQPPIVESIYAKRSLSEAYTLLVANTPDELVNLYDLEDQRLMQEHAWDYKNSELVVNKVKQILEASDPTTLSKAEQEARQEILWFWYHHAISSAIWKHKDQTAAQSFALKALEYQPPEHPNKITQLLAFLVNDQVEQAREWVKTINTEPEKSTASSLVDSYTQHPWWN